MVYIEEENFTIEGDFMTQEVYIYRKPEKYLHDNNKYVRIDNDQHFCVSCHQYAAVSIDCFQCHRDIPEGSGDFHALSNHKDINYNAVVPGTYSLTVQDMANIAPEVHSDDN